MGSTHRAHLIASGGGEKLHEAEREQHKNDLNDFLKSQGVGPEARGAAQAHFDMGYEDGYSGQSPYYNQDWDDQVGGGD